MAGINQVNNNPGQSLKPTNPNAGNNNNPTTSVQDTFSKYKDYFVEDKNGAIVSVDTFFQLLMAEMTNQDPLEPTSNTEFVSQLANFTALQTNTDSLYYNTITYASSLAGKTVTVAVSGKGDELKIETGVVTGVDISDEKKIEVIVNGNRYSLKNVMNVGSGSGSSSGSTGSGSVNSDGAYAVSLIGKTATVKATNDDGETIVDEGVVESVEVIDGEYHVVIGNLAYALDEVVRVKGTSSTVTPPADKDESSGGETETSIMEENEELRKLFS